MADVPLHGRHLPKVSAFSLPFFLSLFPLYSGVGDLIRGGEGKDGVGVKARRMVGIRIRIKRIVSTR